MKKYIDKLKEIDTLVELSIGATMTEKKAIDIYAITNDLMGMVKQSKLGVCVHPYDDVIQDINGYKCTKCKEQLTD